MKRIILAVALCAVTSPAIAALSIDGHGHVSGTNSVTITPTFNVTAGDEIIAFPVGNGGPFTACYASVNGAMAFRKTSNTAGAADPIEEWILTATTSSASEQVSCTQTNFSFITIDAVAITGPYATAPFDGNASVPAAQTVANTDVTISTTNASTLDIFGYRLGIASPTAGSGFTLISGADFSLVEYKIVSTVQTNLDGTIGTGTGTNNGGIGDALTDTAPAPPPSSSGIHVISGIIN